MALIDTIVILICLSLLWILTIIATTVLHELGHVLTAWVLGGSPTLYHNWAQDDESRTLASLAITAAGPLTSLLQGIGFAVSFAMMQDGVGSGTSRFIVLNMACLGFSTAFGYLLITPVPGAGDMNKIAGILQLGLIWQILLAVVGALLLTGLAKYAGAAYQTLNPFEMSSQRLGLLMFAAVPWLVAVATILVLNGNAQDFIIRIYPFFLGFYVLIAVADGPDGHIQATSPMGWTWTQGAFLLALVMLAVGLYVRLKSGISLAPLSGN